jgi:hypothetical protein
MIGILIVFIGAVLVLFLGLNKPEGGMKTLSSLVLLLAGVLSLLESLSILNFERLSNWAPKNMIDFSNGDLMFVSLHNTCNSIILCLLYG